MKLKNNFKHLDIHSKNAFFVYYVYQYFKYFMKSHFLVKSSMVIGLLEAVKYCNKYAVIVIT